MKIIKLGVIVLTFLGLACLTGYLLNTHFANRFEVYLKATNISFQPLPKVEGYLSWGPMQSARVELSVKEFFPTQIYVHASWLGLSITTEATQVGSLVEMKGNYLWKLPKILTAQLNVSGVSTHGQFRLAIEENSMFGSVEIKDFQTVRHQTDAINLTGGCHIRGSMVNMSGVFYCDFSQSQKAAGVWRSKELESHFLLRTETIRFASKLVHALEDIKPESEFVRIKMFKSASGPVELDYAGMNHAFSATQVVN